MAEFKSLNGYMCKDETARKKLTDILKVERFKLTKDSSLTMPANHNYAEPIYINIPTGYKVVGVVGLETHSTINVKTFYYILYQGSKPSIYVAYYNRYASEETIEANKTIIGVDVLFVKE